MYDYREGDSMAVRALYIAVPVIMIIATMVIVFGCLANRGGVDDVSVGEETTITVPAEETTPTQYDNAIQSPTQEVTHLPPTGGP